MSPRKLVLITAGVLALAASIPATALAGDEVKVRDACDPATFNAALGDGACVRQDNRGGRVTFDGLLAAFPAGHDKWSFKGSPTVDAGDSVVARFDRGGEFHTFTEVPAFGAGCVEELNHAMGLTGPPVLDCEAAFSDPSSFVGVGFPRATTPPLTEGTHRFMCAIHPWMKTTVTAD